LPQQLLDDFQREKRLKVKYVEFDNNEVLYKKLRYLNFNVDVMVPSEYMVYKMYQEGLIKKFDRNKKFDTDLNNKLKSKLQGYKPNNDSNFHFFEYAMPYLWGDLIMVVKNDVLQK
jgi:spermidine/putrescine-binding protein